MPFQLIYSSWAAPDLDMADLTAMLAESRTRNQTSGITGVLVLVDGVFFQILEGEKGDVIDLTKKIIRDPRHHGVHVYSERETDQRAFASWSMAYLSPSAEEVARWAEQEGTTTVENVLASLEREPGRLPGMVVNILKAIAKQ